MFLFPPSRCICDALGKVAITPFYGEEFLKWAPLSVFMPLLLLILSSPLLLFILLSPLPPLSWAPKCRPPDHRSPIFFHHFKNKYIRQMEVSRFNNKYSKCTVLYIFSLFRKCVRFLCTQCVFSPLPSFFSRIGGQGSQERKREKRIGRLESLSWARFSSFFREIASPTNGKERLSNFEKGNGIKYIFSFSGKSRARGIQKYKQKRCPKLQLRHAILLCTIYKHGQKSTNCEIQLSSPHHFSHIFCDEKKGGKELQLGRRRSKTL